MTENRPRSAITDAADEVEAESLRREPIFHRPEFGTTREDQDGRLTRRLTLWRRDDDGWKIVCHQVTLIQDA